MAVLVPQPVALLGLQNAAFGADPGACYATDTAAGQTLTADKATGATAVLGATGATVRAVAFGADGTTLHAAAGGGLGTLDTTTGAFSGTVTMTSVVGATGMTVDPEADALYVLDGGAGDVLRRVDPTDGSTVTGGVGGSDSVSIAGATGPVGGIAMSPAGTLYATDTSGAGDRLVTVDLTTGVVAPVAPILIPDGTGGSLPVVDVVGLSFTRSAVLLGSTASGQILRLDPATATATELSTGAGDLQALACASEPGNVVSGTVFTDTDRDGAFAAPETGLAGVPVVLRRAAGGPTVQTTTTAADGTYRFDVGVDRSYEVVVDAADLPPGSGPTTPLFHTADLSATSSATGLDVGAGYASIGGTVFDDLDGNGVKAPTEPGLAGIDVTIAGATATTVVTSGPDGVYDLGGLAAGDYTVSVDAAAGPGPLTTAATRTVTVAPAEDRNDVDHGYDGSAEVAGLVFDDLDRNRVQSGPGEIPLSGVVIQVIDPTTGALRGTATSAADGTYTIGDLSAGDVTVQVDPASIPDGGSLTTTSPDSRTLTPGVTSRFDVGIELRATIGGRVFDDLDANGADDAEPGLSGIGVRLLDGSGAQVGSTSTSGDGSFVFGDLAAGTYTVSVDPASGPGGVPATTATDVSVTVGAIEADRTTRVGFAGGTAIRGVVYDDVDRDGALGGGDSPLANVRVQLRSGGTLVATSTTGLDGRYAATALPAGTYTVDVDPSSLPPGATTTTTLPLTVTTAPGEDRSGVDVGVDTTVTLRGRVFSDRNADGTLGTGEPGIVGLAVTVTDAATGAVLGTATTSVAGRWSLVGMPQRPLVVTVTPPVGATLTTANQTQTVTPLQAGPLTVPPTGYAFGAVAGTVFGDLDADGVQDADESGLSGVSVRVRDASGAVIAIATTTATGTYRLDEIPAGDHTVVVSQASLPGSATAPAPQPVTVTAATTSTVDVAVDTRASVAGVVWNDLDGDGLRGPSEPGIDGAAVVATDPATGAETGRAVASSLGTYRIAGLRPGDHRITVDLTTLPSATAVRTNAPTGVLTLGVAEARTGVDHGYDLGGSIAGTVFNDVDGDGTIDANEPGFSGVTVEVRAASDGSLVTTASTGPAGSYTVDRLPAGTYDVLVVASTLPDPSASPTLGNPRRVTLSSLEDLVGLDLGFDAGASLAGTVWNDLDGDGARQAGEPGLAGVRITVTDGAGATVGSATSGASGAWSVVDLVPASVTVAVDAATLPSGATVTRAPTPATFTLAPGESRTGADVGVDAAVALAGRVFNDLDGDGIDDPDPGLDGTEVVLRDGAGTEVARATVATGTGAYRFDRLAPGTWTVAVDPTSVPTGAPLTTATASFTRTLSPAQEAVGLDVGYGAGATIAGVLFDDVDGDRVQGTGEPGLAGRTVEARDGATVVASATVGADGSFTLRSLPPGTYDVVLLPADEAALAAAGYVRRTLDDPVTVTVAAAQTVDTVAIGYWRPASIAVELFDDVDGSGAREAPEPGHAAADVVLSTDPDGDGNPVDGVVVSTLPTDAEGRVTFPDLPPGSYVVDADLPARTIITVGEDPASVTVAPGERASVLTGTQAYAPAVSATTPPALRGEAGDELVHPVVITNDGNVADVYDLVATSDQGATVTILRDVDGDGVRDPEDTTVLTSTATVAPGATASVLVVVTLTSGLPRGTVDTTVLDITSTIDPAVATASTATSTLLSPVMDVAIVSGVGAGFITPGELVAYTVTVSDLLPDADVADARDVVLEVELADPTHGTVEPGSIAIDGVAQPTATFPLTIALLPAGASTDVTFDLRAARPLPDGTAVTAVARVSATGNPEGDPREATDAATDVVDSSPIPELGVTSSPSSGTIVEPGDVITYTVVVGDRTDATATWEDVTLVADLPPELVALDATVDGVPVGTVFAPAAPGALPDLDPGDLVRVVLRAQVADPVQDATALAAIFEVDGANAGPLVAATTHTVRVDRAVALDPDRSGRGPAGTTVAHPHVLRNDGNVTTVFDLTATTDQGWPSWLVDDLDADGVLDPGEPTVTGTGPVAGGAQRHLLSVVEVPATEPDGVTGTTTVATFAADGYPVHDQVLNVTEVVAPVLSVRISPTPSSTVVNRGQRVTYGLTVRNTGKAVARGVTLTNTVPTAAQYVQGSTTRDAAPLADAPGGRSPLVSGLALGDIPAGGSTVVAFEVTVTAVDDGTPLVARATVSDAEGRTASDSTVQIVAAGPVLDLTLTPSPAGPTVRAGQALTYTAVVRNAGTLDATGVVVTSAVPARTLYVAGSTTFDGAPVADRAGTTPLQGGLAVGTLAPGASRTIRFAATVLDPVLSGEEIRTVATATSDQGVSSTPPAVVLRTAVQPNLALTGSGARDVARPGQAAYAHTITNTGDVSDSFTLTARSSQGWRVSILRDDDRDGSWDPTREVTPVTATGPLAPGASMRVIVVVEVAATVAIGAVDTTTLTARSLVSPSVSATASDRTRATAPSLGLTMSAVPSGARVNPGQSITYVVAVRNLGAAPATDVVVRGSTPAGTTYVADSTTRDGARVPDGTAADGNPLAVGNGGVRIPSISPGAEVLLTYAVRVPRTTPSGQVVLARVEAGSADTSPVTAEQRHTVAPGPVLDVQLAADPATARPTPAGTRISYTITVANSGQEAARGLRLVDDTPRDATYVPRSTTRNGAAVADGRTDPNPLSSVYGGLLLGDVAPGAAPVTVRFQVVVDDPVPVDATIENVAIVRAGELEARSALLVHSLAVTPGATVTPNLAVNAVPGGFADLAHVVANTGDVTDAFSLAATSERGWVASIRSDLDADGLVDVGEPEITATPVLAPGERTPIIVRLAVPPDTALDVRDAVRVEARSSLDPTRGGAAADTVRIVANALRLVADARPSTLAPGGESTYRLTLSNIGRSSVPGVVLADAVPDGTAYVAGSTTRDGQPVPDLVDGGSPLAAGFPIGTLAPGVDTVLEFRVAVADDTTLLRIVNSATAAAPGVPTVRAGTVQPLSRRFGFDLRGSGTRTASPGTTVVHPHELVGTGQERDQVTVTATSSLAAPATIHLDLDGDGELGVDDPVLDGPLDLRPGAAVRLLAVVTYPADAPEGVEDTVSVTARSLADAAVEVTVADTTRLSGATVTVTTTATPAGDVAAGDLVVYDLVVRNGGQAAVTPVTVVADVPAGARYEPQSVTLDGAPVDDVAGGNPLASAAGGLSLGELAPGATRAVRLAVRVGADATAGTVLALAGVVTTVGGTATSNTVRSTVIDRTGVQVRKQASPDRVVEAGERITWALTITNEGDRVASGVVLTDPPVAGTRYVPGTTTVDGVAAGDGIVAGSGLELGDLEPGGLVTVTFQTLVDVPGAVVQNIASVRHSGGAAQVLSNLAAVEVGPATLPATGAPTGRTLGGATALLLAGWALLFVARPERRARPVLTGIVRRGA